MDDLIQNPNDELENTPNREFINCRTTCARHVACVQPKLTLLFNLLNKKLNVLSHQLFLEQVTSRLISIKGILCDIRMIFDHGLKNVKEEFCRNWAVKKILEQQIRKKEHYETLEHERMMEHMFLVLKIFKNIENDIKGIVNELPLDDDEEMDQKRLGLGNYVGDMFASVLTTINHGHKNLWIVEDELCRMGFENLHKSEVVAAVDMNWLLVNNTAGGINYT